MSRPLKTGLDYFALDCEMDDSVKIIESQHGTVGFAIIIKLFQLIYGDKGYYCDWSVRGQLLFNHRVSDIEKSVTRVVNDSLEWGIFDKEMFEKYSILTSQRIQKHYITSVYKRVGVDMINEYLLVDIPSNSKITVKGVSVVRNSPTTRVSVVSNAVSAVSDISNAATTRVSVVQSTQSKVNKSKVKNNKSVGSQKGDSDKPIKKPVVVDVDITKKPEYKISTYLYKKMLVNNPRAKEPNFKTWSKHIDLLFRINKRSHEEIIEVIDWCQNDSFWMGNILSTSKLRDKFDQLLLQMKRNGYKKPDKVQTPDDLPDFLKERIANE